MDSYNKQLEIAIKAVTVAGDFLKQNYKNSKAKVLSDKERDIKLTCDLKAERLAFEVLSELSEFPIISEESIALEIPLDDKYRWVLDPLDGTYNYFRGIEHWCVSLSLCRGEKAVVGCVYVPSSNKLFYAFEGGGAFLNNKKIKVSDTKTKSNGCLFTGFPVSTSFSEEEMRKKIFTLKEYKKVRMLGSAAVMLSYIAAGIGDAYWENGIYFWDISAGLLLVKEAGGEIEIKKITKHTYDVFAHNSYLY